MIRRIVILPILLLAIAVMPLLAQTATSVRVDRVSPDDFLGAVVVTVNGEERTIAEEAVNVWLIERGRAVVYSGTDGAGGYENEGQSLWRYNVKTGEYTKLMTELFFITDVREARTRLNRNALLVSMVDGGLGAPHVAIAHPTRGQVWRHQGAQFVGVKNGFVRVAVYDIMDFELVEDPKPRKILIGDLDAVLRRTASPDWPISVPRPEPNADGTVY